MTEEKVRECSKVWQVDIVYRFMTILVCSNRLSPTAVSNCQNSTGLQYIACYKWKSRIHAELYDHFHRDYLESLQTYLNTYSYVIFFYLRFQINNKQFLSYILNKKHDQSPLFKCVATTLIPQFQTFHRKL